MQIERIKITNVMGHENIEFSPGKMNVIEGNNGTGKSSILEALLSAFKGTEKKEATLLRKDATVGQTVIILDDNTEIVKTYTTEGSKLNVKNQSKPSEFINKIRDLASFSPATFLMSEPKQQLQLLLEALNIKFTKEELTELCGDFNIGEILARIGLKDNTEFDLNEFGTIRKNVYDERTGINRAVSENEKTLSKLIETVPVGAVDIDELKVKLTAKEAELQSLNDYKQNRVSEEQTKFSDAQTSNSNALNKALEELSREKEIEIRLIHEKYNRLIAEAKDSHELLTNESLEKRDKSIATIQEKFEEQRLPITAEILELKNNLENFASIKKQQELITELSSKAEILTLKSKQCTAILDAIDDKTKSKSEHIPIKGLYVQNGEITVEGVAFNRVNTERKIRVALALARLRAGELKVVCMDNMEALSSEYFQLFVQAAKNTDLQFFVTRVADTPLTIKADELTLDV